MDQPLPPNRRKKTLYRIALIAIVAGAAALFALRDFHALYWINRGVQAIAQVGPWPFFLTMALVPAVGVPTSIFALTAGRAFSDRMGMPGVVVAGCAAMTVNLAITYWIARSALRPWLIRLLARLGYRMPEVSREDTTDLLVILRLTPGFPFFVQNYLLGLADTPALRYFVFSCLFVWPNNTLFIVFGDALLRGKGSLVIGTVGLLLVVAAATHMLRRHYRRKPAAA